MIAPSIAAVLLLSGCVSVQAFDCSQSCALLIPDDDTSMRYQIITDTLTYMPGSTVHVTLNGYNASFPYRGVILQAKRMGDNRPTGAFMGGTNHPNALMLDCARDTFSDTICVTSDDVMETVRATWQPPQPAGTAHHVEFQALFMDLDNVIHRQHSVILEEKVPDVEVEEPEDDLHDDRTEGEMISIKNQEMQDTIDQENLATEDDLGQLADKERKDHEAEVRWEETEYEIEQKAEEDARRARIQAEIRDKEEFDQIQFEKEEKEREERERAERERVEREQREREQREEAERERKRKEQEERDRNRTFREGPGEEVDPRDKPDVGGSPKMVVVSTVTMVLATVIAMVL